MANPDSELMRKFFRMETTMEENAQIKATANKHLQEIKMQIANQEKWHEQIGRPAVKLFCDINIAYPISPDTVKTKILAAVNDLKTAVTEKNDLTATAILLEVRKRFEEERIHPDAKFPFLDWVDQSKTTSR